MKESSKNTKLSRLVKTAVILLVLCATVVVTLVACKKTTETTTPATGTATGTGVPTVPSSSATGVITSKDDAFYSPSSVSVGDDGAVYVSDATKNIVTKFSSEGEAVATYSATGTVNRVLAEGEKIYVLEGGLDGKLTVLTTDLKKESQIDVGHTPCDIVIVSGKAYISNRFDNAVGVVDLASGKQTSEIAVEREPRAMVLVGNDLYVGCFLTGQISVDDNISSKVEVIDTSSNKVKKQISLTNGSNSILGLASSPDGESVYVTHLISRYTYPTSQLDRGWVNTNAFSVINTADYSATSVLLDELEHGAANPWDVECSVDGKTLYFSLAGTHEIMTVDVERLNKAVSNVKNGKDDNCDSLTDISEYIPFLEGAKKRYTTGGNGLRDIEVSGEKLYVTQYFTGNVAVMNLSDMTVASTMTAGKQPEETSARLGEYLWYDGSSCYQQWESCSSCHPEGRSDGLNWDEGGDGWGTPKNTRSMMFALRTPPAMATGFVAAAEINVKESLHFVYMNHDINDEQVEAVNEYLRSLLPVESPYLNRDGSYTEAAVAGKKLFEEVGCAECHPAPLYTDLKLYNSPYIGGDGTWEDREITTPSLVEVWRSAPFNFYGGTNDMNEVVKKFANRTLTDDEAGKIAEFVLSIGIVDEKYGVEQVLGTDGSETIYCKVVPGKTIDSVSVRKQYADAPNAKVTIKLVGADGKEINSKQETLEGMAYNTSKTIALNWTVPSDIKEGSYIEVSITDATGNAIASVYKLTYTK